MAKRKVSRPSLPGMPEADQAGGTGGTGLAGAEADGTESVDDTDEPAEGDSSDEADGDETSADPVAKQSPPARPQQNDKPTPSARVRCVVVGTVLMSGRELGKGHELTISRADFVRINSGARHLEELT